MTNIAIPAKFEERMKILLGRDYEKFREQILTDDNIRAIRVNSRKIDVEDFLHFSPYSLEKIPYNHDGFYLFDDVRMGGEVCHQAGMFYMQEPSAMIPVNAVDIQPDWKILDLCAAPGGKTSQLSNALSEEGLVVSNDVKFERCRALVDNVERLGLSNVLITSGTGDEICGSFQSFFDLVLIDATCSGEGMFRKNKNIMNMWSEKKVAACVAIQRSLLDQAVATLKGGGRLVYSTCTFSTAEDEEVVDYFLRKHPEFSLLDCRENVLAHTLPGIMINQDFDFSKTRRFYPHSGRGEGQYVAVFQKNTGDSIASYTQGKNKIRDFELSCARKFLSEVGLDIPDIRLLAKGDNIWILPKTTILLKKHVVNHGVLLGTMANDTLIPSHAFFMAFGNQLDNQIDFNDIHDSRLASYLAGEDLCHPCNDGWGAVCIHGCTLGGFYARKGRLQNLYPKYLTNKEIFD